VGASPPMRELFQTIRRVAASRATVLLQGESGTGKELVARAIHDLGERADQPFVAVNCAALPDQLIESELFGHERGAFTDARERRIGKFETAAGGTLFLDEIGELGIVVQAKLLRALQEKQIERLGGSSPIEVDVRVVAATNRNLEADVAEGRFRADLFYRINVVPIALPALAERREDIPPLVYHFIRRFNGECGYSVEGIRQDALDRLVDAPWPGNVRQLENVTERAVILRKAGLVQPVDLPPELQTPGSADPGRTLDDLERQHILQLVEECDGNQSRVARILGISRRTVYRKLRQYGINDGE